MIDDELTESSRYYNNEINVNNDRKAMDFVDLMLSERERQFAADEQLRYYENFTDYEEKKLTEKLNFKKQEFVDHVNSRINKKLPTEIPQEEPQEFDAVEALQKGLSAGADPIGTGLKLASQLGKTDIPGLKQYGQAAGMTLDFVNGVRKSVVKTVAAIPQLVEDGWAEISAPPEALTDFNDVLSERIEDTFKSSGEYTYNGMDIPHMAGEIMGHFVLPVGTGAMVLKATQGMSKLAKGASLLTSEAALNAILTNKETGSFLNLFWDKNEEQKVPLMLRMLHIDEDDSAFEARLKGALEGIVQVGAFSGIAAGVKKIKTAARATRDAAVVKHLNDDPDVALRFSEHIGEGAEFDDKAFKKYVFDDFVSKEVDHYYRQFSEYLKEETGTLTIKFGPLDDSARAVDEFADEAVKQIDSKKEELKSLTGSKSKTGKKKASKLKDEINQLTTDVNEAKVFKQSIDKGKKTGDFEEAKGYLRELVKKKPVHNKIKSKLKEHVDMMDEFTSFFDDMKKSDLTTYNSLKHIFKDITSKNANSEILKDSNFLSLMNKSNSDINDLVSVVRNDEVLQKDIDIASKKYFNFDVKKGTDTQVIKEVRDFASTYGLDPQALLKLEKEELMSLPKVVMTEQYILKQGLDNLGRVSERMAEIMADGSKYSKQKLQAYTVNFIENYKGMQKLSQRVAQRRSDIGASLRLYRKDVRQKAFEQVSSEKFNLNDVASDDVQQQFIAKLLTADPGEAKRMANKINDVVKLMKNGKLNEVQALAKLAKGETLDKVMHNLSTFAYNNMLWGPTTAIKNAVGLTTNYLIDTFEDAAVKILNKNSYYSIEDLDLETQREVLNIMNQLDENMQASMDLVNSSKFFSGIRNDNGTIKSAKDLFSESFYLGKSMIDPGSEKFGVGYKSFNTTELSVIDNHLKTFGTDNIDNKLAKSYFNETFLEDANIMVSKDEAKKKLFKEMFHSSPLRLLNATDDVFKSMTVHKKMNLFAKQKVNKALARMEPKELAEYKKNFQENYFRDLKNEYSNVDNFDEAMSSAREMSLTKQYGDFTGEQFKVNTPFGQMQFDKLSKALQENRLLKFFFPFARISVNMADYLTQYLPGYIKVPSKIFGKSTGELGGKYFALNNNVAEELSAGGYRKSKAIAKMGVGLGISGMGVALVKNNILTGAAPSDAYGKYQWQQSGVQPYSFNFGSFSIPLNMSDPFGKYLSFVADVYNAGAKQSNDDDDSFAESTIPFLMNAGFAVGSLATPEVLTETMGMLHRWGSSQHKTAEALMDTTRGLSTLFSKGIPFSGLFRFGERLASPEMGRTFEYDKDGVAYIDTIVNTFRKNVPFLSTTSVKNMFNDDVYYHNLPKEAVGDAVDQSFINSMVGGFSSVMSNLGRIKEKQSEPIYKQLRDLSLHLPTTAFKDRELPLPKLNRRITVRGSSVNLTNDQYNELIGYANGYNPNGKKFMRPMKEHLNILVEKEWFRKESDYMKALIIRNVVSKYQKIGREMFKSNNKQFQNDMIERINEKISQRMGLEQ